MAILNGFDEMPNRALAEATACGEGRPDTEFESATPGGHHDEVALFLDRVGRGAGRAQGRGLMANGSKDVDAYLAKIPEPARSALPKLRAQIKAAAGVNAEELINYGVPMFRAGGKNLDSYGAAKAHCSFFVQSLAVMEHFARNLEDYDTSKGTIRFQPEKPIPAALVKKIVQGRLYENEVAAKAKAK
jgi:uncharacterized protein YdhG (YjbR/CyaY superfamily)